MKGFICLVKLEEFSKGIILPHEETLSKAKEDRFHLMEATGCNFSQIYSLYMDEAHTTGARLDALSSGKPRYEFSDGAVTHRMWIVNDRRSHQGDLPPILKTASSTSPTAITAMKRRSTTATGAANTARPRAAKITS